MADYSGLTDLELRAIGLDPRDRDLLGQGVDHRELAMRNARNRRTLERRAGDAFSAAPAVNRSTSFTDPLGQRTPGSDLELLSVPPGMSQPTPADQSPQNPYPELEANESIERIKDRFDPAKTPVSPGVEARAAELSRQGYNSGMRDTHQQRFRNANAYGLAERNPDGVRSTPAGAHPLDQEAARFAERNKSRITTPAAPPLGVSGQSVKSQYYADRASPEPTPADTKPTKRIYRGEVIPADQTVPTPMAPIEPRVMEPSAAGAERIAASKRRKADADVLIKENAMANRASRRNRMGMVNPYISPEIRDLHRMGDEERDLRDRMAGDVAANRDRELDIRERAIAGESGWRTEDIKERGRQFDEQNRLAEKNANRRLEMELWGQRRVAAERLAQAERYAQNATGDPNARYGVEAARRDLEFIDGQLSRLQAQAIPGQPAPPVAPTAAPQAAPQGGGQSGGGQSGGGPLPPIVSPAAAKIGEVFNRHVQRGPDGRLAGQVNPDQVIRDMINELGTSWVRDNMREFKAYVEQNVPGGYDALDRALRQEEWDANRGFATRARPSFNPNIPEQAVPDMYKLIPHLGPFLAIPDAYNRIFPNRQALQQAAPAATAPPTSEPSGRRTWRQ